MNIVAFRILGVVGRCSCQRLNQYFLQTSRLSLTRTYGSALFIPDKKGHESYSFLSPKLDFDKRFNDLDRLKKEMLLRNVDIDVVSLKEAWESYKCVLGKKQILEEKRVQIADRSKDLHQKAKRTAEEEKELLELQEQGKLVKKDLKDIRDVIFEYEENSIIPAFKLPNELDPRTPAESSKIMDIIGVLQEIPREHRKSHVQIGTSLGLLDYRSPIEYYLLDNAAFFELGVLELAGRLFKEMDMTRVAGMDFSHSRLVEGSGLDYENPTDTFILQDDSVKISDHMHLVGSATLISILALYTKQLSRPSLFPVKHFATGREYKPVLEDTPLNGLFTICQSSVAHAFIMVKDAEDAEIELEDLLQTVKKLYRNICSHYRIVKRSAAELRSWESLRISFEMWSQFSGEYIEVGHISTYGDFLSKRLLIGYQAPKGNKFPLIISGMVLSVPRVLGCLLEQNPDKFLIPPEVEKCFPQYCAAEFTD